MSNLIKSVYFNVQEDESCVINSNKKLDEIFPKQPEVLAEDSEGAEEYIPFSSGLQIVDVEHLVDENLHKAEEASENDYNKKTIEEEQKLADEIIGEAEQSADDIRERAYEEGKAQGLSEGRAQADEYFMAKKQEADEMLARAQEEIERQQEELEPVFVDILIALIYKISGVVLKDRKEVLIYLMHRALRGLGTPEKIRIRISGGDMLRVNAAKSTLKKAVAEGVDFDIVEESTLTKNQCIIETEDKIIDCSLDVQLKSLEEQLKLLTYL